MNLLEQHKNIEQSLYDRCKYVWQLICNNDTYGIYDSDLKRFTSLTYKVTSLEVIISVEYEDPYEEYYSCDDDIGIPQEIFVGDDNTILEWWKQFSSDHVSLNERNDKIESITRKIKRLDDDKIQVIESFINNLEIS